MRMRRNASHPSEIDPGRMTAEERLHELAALLAQAVRRQRARPVLAQSPPPAAVCAESAASLDPPGIHAHRP